MDCLVSVGIATLNGVTRIDPLLASIAANTHGIDYKIVVIDDGSTERNLRQLRELCSMRGILLEEHRTNQGISTTWNHLANRFDSEYVALLNDDVLVRPGWLQALVHFIQHNQRVGTVGLHPNRDGKIVVCGGGELDPSAPEAKIPHRVVAANGYCFLFQKAVWRALNGFDETFMSFYEEVDFGVRCWREGLQSFNLPWPVIEHEWSSTFAQNDGLLLPQIRMKQSREHFIGKWGKDLPELLPELKRNLLPPHDLKWLTEAGEQMGSHVLEVNR